MATPDDNNYKLLFSDPEMVKDLLTGFVKEAWEALTPNEKRPPVLPLVLYNGESRWSTAQNISELVELVPGELEHYCPNLSYLLPDEGAIVNQPEWSKTMRNLVAALFRFEHNRDEQDMLEVLGSLIE
ncbi:Rpn family recombination-promoting nuclease/putative transposase [Nitrincola tapanii]|uniref:Rpn family recombination-promoting nuclease/putative transposase n=1 Tax=Nitrincola tapanii TaxID=1708751 RepID=UPI001F285563|nr:Rpn family recombination-promoting nuclease/putative transposase [Nitrincola tapanii]